MSPTPLCALACLGRTLREPPHGGPWRLSWPGTCALAGWSARGCPVKPQTLTLVRLLAGSNQKNMYNSERWITRLVRR